MTHPLLLPVHFDSSAGYEPDALSDVPSSIGLGQGIAGSGTGDLVTAHILGGCSLKAPRSCRRFCGDL
jgi:hypothetical protein